MNMDMNMSMDMQWHMLLLLVMVNDEQLRHEKANKSFPKKPSVPTRSSDFFDSFFQNWLQDFACRLSCVSFGFFLLEMGH